MVDPTPPFGMTASIVYKMTVLCVDCCCGLSARTIMYLVIVASFPGPCHGQDPPKSPNPAEELVQVPANKGGMRGLCKWSRLVIIAISYSFISKLVVPIIIEIGCTYRRTFSSQITATLVYIL